MKKPCIEIKNVSLEIAGKSILNNISLKIFSGDFVSIIGPNGAGKTSLLKVLMKIYPFTSGEVYIFQKPLHRYSQKQLARLISYVPQSDGRSIPLTVQEFVLLGRYPHLKPFGSYTAEDKIAAKQALEITHIAHLSQRFLFTLSGGERQIVFIAAALAQGAEILLLDEPTTFLDPKHELDVYQILSQINHELGKTIISVTHDINNATLRSKRVVVLKNGAIHFQGEGDNIMSNEILRTAYDMEFQFSTHPANGRKIIVPTLGAQ